MVPASVAERPRPWSVAEWAGALRLNAFRHYTNRLKAFKTQVQGLDSRCFRSFRPQVQLSEPTLPAWLRHAVAAVCPLHVPASRVGGGGRHRIASHRSPLLSDVNV